MHCYSAAQQASGRVDDITWNVAALYPFSACLYIVFSSFMADMSKYMCVLNSQKCYMCERATLDNVWTLFCGHCPGSYEEIALVSVLYIQGGQYDVVIQLPRKGI